MCRLRVAMSHGVLRNIRILNSCACSSVHVRPRFATMLPIEHHHHVQQRPFGTHSSGLSGRHKRGCSHVIGMAASSSRRRNCWGSSWQPSWKARQHCPGVRCSSSGGPDTEDFRSFVQRIAAEKEGDFEAVFRTVQAERFRQALVAALPDPLADLEKVVSIDDSSVTKTSYCLVIKDQRIDVRMSRRQLNVSAGRVLLERVDISINGFSFSCLEPDAGSSSNAQLVNINSLGEALDSVHGWATGNISVEGFLEWLLSPCEDVPRKVYDAIGDERQKFLLELDRNRNTSNMQVKESE